MSGLQHVITLQPPFDGTAIYLCCSCSDEPIAKVGFPEAAASLVEVNEIAHRHITTAEGPSPAFAPIHTAGYDDLKRRSQISWPSWATSSTAG